MANALTRVLLPCGILIAVGTACDPQPARDAHQFAPVDCAPAPSSRWGGIEYAATALVGDEGVTGFHGATFVGPSLLVWDRRVGEVWRFDSTAGRAGGFGRFGEGPGEFSRPGWMRARPYSLSSWITTLGDTIAVFDGNRVSLFDTAGAFRTQLSSARTVLDGGLRFSRRIRLDSAAILIDVEEREDYGRDAGRDGRPYRIWRVTAADAQPVLTLQLPALPRDSRGAAFQSSREAVPMWDFAVGCIVASDGSTPYLIVRGAIGVDSIHVPLDETRAAGLSEEPELLRRLGAPDDAPIEPVLPLRIRDLIADPDGWVWMRLVGRTSELPILRVNPRDGRVEFDTVPAFPLAFGPRATYVGALRDADGNVRLHRFEAR